MAVDVPGVASRGLPRRLLLVSVLAHGALAAALFWAPAERMRVGTDEQVQAVSVELVAAPAKRKPEEQKPSVAERPKPEVKAADVKPVVRRSKRDSPVPAATAPAVAAPVVAPVTAIPADGEARVSSIAVETRAAGRRAYGGLVWKRIADRKPAGLHREGTAHVTFSIDAGGNIGTISIAQSSGDAALDALALRTVKEASPFPLPPAYLTPGDLVFEIAFDFR